MGPFAGFGFTQRPRLTGGSERNRVPALPFRVAAKRITLPGNDRRDSCDGKGTSYGHLFRDCKEDAMSQLFNSNPTSMHAIYLCLVVSNGAGL
jgi:hypothetical protein